MDSQSGQGAVFDATLEGKARAACPSGRFPCHRWGAGTLVCNDQFTNLGMEVDSSPTPIAIFMVATAILMAIVER